MVPEPPSPWMTAGEALSGIQLVRLGARAHALATAPRGDGAPVLLVPGLGASDASLAPLRRFLQSRGHDARPAELGRIHGNVPQLARRLIERSAAVGADTGRAVSLVGWSIGGVLARETARERPDLIRRVATFGTPVIGGPAHTAMARRYSEAELIQIERLIDERNRAPIRVPITAIWSRRDGIVSPVACIDDHSPAIENIEVSSTHFGMGIDPDVWAIIADRLAV